METTSEKQISRPQPRETSFSKIQITRRSRTERGQLRVRLTHSYPKSVKQNHTRSQTKCYVREPMVNPRRRNLFFHRWTKSRQKGESNTTTRTKDRFFDWEFNVNPRIHFRAVPGKDHASRLVDCRRLWSGVDAANAPPLLLSRIIFMNMMTALEHLHKNDDLCTPRTPRSWRLRSKSPAKLLSFRLYRFKEYPEPQKKAERT